jgi:hypothetical protein
MFLVVVLLLTPVVRGEAADQKASVPQEAPVPAPSPSPVIPLAEVASRAMEVEALLRTYRMLHASPPATSMIEKQLPEASALIGLELERTQPCSLLIPSEEPPARWRSSQRSCRWRCSPGCSGWVTP